ncbi:MAG: PAS domain S-box protein [Sulfurimicrobium sp.]|nr:PAS domain S-box protein [Sulfurimicrobium sp.]
MSVSLPVYAAERINRGRLATLKLFLLLYIPMALLLSGLVYGFLNISTSLHLRDIKVQEKGEVKVASQLINHDFRLVSSDLQVLSKATSLRNFLDGGSREEKERLTRLFQTMAGAKQIYDQIRLLDEHGMEVIRVDWKDGEARAAPEAELQDKGQRYYFRDAFSLKNGEIYISPLDLNVEHGKLELPHKPMLRFGTPVFDSAGRKMGIVLINYLGKGLLEDFQHAMGEKRHAVLLNREGHWLSSPDAAQAWGFMQDGGKRFGNLYPAEWKRISGQESGDILTENGLLTFTTVYPLIDGQYSSSGSTSPTGASEELLTAQQYFWKIVSMVPANEVPAANLTRFPRTALLFLLALMLFAILAEYLALGLLGRRQLRQAVAENEARLREITATLAEAVYVIDTRGLIVFINPETERLLGWPESELIGQHAHSKFHHRRIDGAQLHVRDCPIYQALATGEVYRGDTEVFWCKDGSPLPVSVSASPIVRDGKMTGAVVAFSDIRERKLAREALLKSEAQLKEGQRLTHMGSWELDLVTNVLFWSDEIYRIFEIDSLAFGASYEAFLGLIHPEDRARVDEAFNFSVKNRVPYSIEHRLLFPDGRIKFVVEWGETFYDAGGQPVRSVGTVQDITERKKAEDERLHAEALFHMVFDNAGDAILIHDVDGRFLEVNRIMCERLGYSRDELLRLSPPDINAPEQAGKFAERVKALQENGQITFETVHVTKDGRHIPVEVSARLIDFGGRPATLSVVRDITQRKRSEAALRQSEERGRALLNAAAETAMLMDQEGTVLAINEIGARRFGKTPEEMFGHNFYAMLSPEVAASRREKVSEVFQTAQPVHLQDKRDDYCFDSRIYPILDADGRVSQVAIYAADVTEKTQLQAVDTLLHEIDQQVLRSKSLAGLLHFICADMARLFGYRFAWIGRKRADGSVAISAWAGSAAEYHGELERLGVRWDDTPQGQGPTGSTIRSGQTQVFKFGDPGFRPWRESAERFDLRAIVSVPLIIRGEVYGAFTLYSQHERSFDDPATLQRLNNIANRICVALETAMDQEQLRLLSTALSSAGNGVFITDQRGRIRWINASFTRLTGFSSEEAVGETLSILKSGKQDDAYYQTLWKTILAGKVWSSETVERRKNGTFFTVQQTITPIRDEEGEITHYISILEDISAQKETEARIQYMAHFDALTDLPNRALFYDRLRQVLIQAKRDKHSCALMFLDLDHFKAINDTLGHHVGDLLLQGVARRLKKCVRESDTVARLAGDEFTVLLPRAEKREDTRLVAEKILAALARPFLLEGREVSISGSIGIALYPDDGDRDDVLVKNADQAMYAAKQQGRNNYCFFEASAPESL